MSEQSDYTASLLNSLARKVKAGRLDEGPKKSFEEYNGAGAWAEANDVERKMERDSFALALRAIAKSLT